MLAARLCLDGGNSLASLGGNVKVLGAGDLGRGGREDDLNVAGVALVGVDATVGAVGTAAGLGGLLDDDVLDDELVRSEVLGLGVRLGVLEETEDELDRLDGPATWTWVSLPAAASKTSKSTHPWWS